MTGAPARFGGRSWFRSPDEAANRSFPATFAFAQAYAFAMWFPLAEANLPVSVTQAATAALLGAFALESVLRHKRIHVGFVRAEPASALLTLAGLLLVAAAGIAATASAADRVGAATFALRYLIGIAVIWAVATCVRDRGRVTRLAVTTALGGFAAASLATLGSAIPAVAATTLGVASRTEGFFEHPNQFGMMLSTTLPVALALAFRAGRIGKLIFLTATGAMFYAVAQSGSFVNTTLALAAIALTLTAAVWMRADLRVAAGTSALLVVVAATLVATAPQWLEPWSPRVAEMSAILIERPGAIDDALPSVKARLALYARAVEVIRSHPWWGIGGDNASRYLTTDFARNVTHAHNMFLNNALAAGVGGLLGTLLLAIGWLRLADRLARSADRRRVTAADGTFRAGLATALVVFFLSNQASDSLGGTIVYVLWLWLGMGFAILAFERRRGTATVPVPTPEPARSLERRGDAP